MSLSAKKRRTILGIALVGTLMATIWANQQTEGEAPAVQAPSSVASRAVPRQDKKPETQAKIDLARLHRPDMDAKVDNVFASKSWYVPPAPKPQASRPLPPSKPLPPPPPSAPPLSFTYLGRLMNEGQTTVFVAWQGRNIAVKTGDVLDSTYRVDAVESGRMTLTYLPLNIQQTLYFGEKS